MVVDEGDTHQFIIKTRLLYERSDDVYYFETFKCGLQFIAPARAYRLLQLAFAHNIYARENWVNDMLIDPDIAARKDAVWKIFEGSPLNGEYGGNCLHIQLSMIVASKLTLLTMKILCISSVQVKYHII